MGSWGPSSPPGSDRAAMGDRVPRLCQGPGGTHAASHPLASVWPPPARTLTHLVFHLKLERGHEATAAHSRCQCPEPGSKVELAALSSVTSACTPARGRVRVRGASVCPGPWGQLQPEGRWALAAPRPSQPQPDTGRAGASRAGM